MSQFAGYVLPGCVFIAFGLKWSLDASSPPYDDEDESESEDLELGSFRGNGDGGNSLRKIKKNRQKRRGRCCCGFCCCSGCGSGRGTGWPVEGILKLTVTFIGIAASVAAAYPSGNGKLQFVGDILYATVYLFFAISGLVDVLIYYCPYTIPFGLDKFSLALAFAIEGLMFHLHLSHQAFMEQHVHILLVCAIWSCAFVCLVEIVMPYSLMVKFARAFFTLVHGSWYIQSGFILYNPTKSAPSTWFSSDDYNSALVWISLTFAWHCAGAFVILLVLLLLARRKRLPPSPQPPNNIEIYEPPLQLQSQRFPSGASNNHHSQNSLNQSRPPVSFHFSSSADLKA